MTFQGLETYGPGSTGRVRGLRGFLGAMLLLLGLVDFHAVFFDDLNSVTMLGNFYPGAVAVGAVVLVLGTAKRPASDALFTFLVLAPGVVLLAVCQIVLLSLSGHEDSIFGAMFFLAAAPFGVLLALAGTAILLFVGR